MRRLFWMATGAALGSIGSRWTRRTAARMADQYAPVAVGRRVAGNARHRLQAARHEGRAAMADTEARLRAQVGGGPAGGAQDEATPGQPDRDAARNRALG
jgi:hypothetical protein